MASRGDPACQPPCAPVQPLRERARSVGKTAADEVHHESMSDDPIATPGPAGVGPALLDEKKGLVSRPVRLPLATDLGA